MIQPAAGAATGGYIARHAAERPEAVAVVSRGRAIPYAELARDIARVAAALREFRVPRGGLAAVGCDDLYIHWLLLLAFERLNVGTASYHSGEDPAGCRELLSGADLVLAEEHFATPGAVRHHAITPAWLKAVLARPPDDASTNDAGAPSDPMRILRSSGTTGRPKRLVVTRRMNEPRLAVYARQYQFERGSRYFLTLPFSAGPIYGAATACLRAGGTVISERFEGGAGTARVIAAHGITHITLQPIMLKQVLDDLPPDFVRPVALHVVTLGSALSDELSGRALARLATEVTDVFGCNEVGGVSHRRASRRDAFAEVSPELTVETVDEQDRPVAAGTPGRLRIRTEGMVEGYLGEPELTHRHFQNGWFYPGDMAVLDGPRRLRIIGRGGELLNIGGAKSRPDDLEALVMRHVGAADVGICTLPNREGIEEIYVAVSGVRYGNAELLTRVQGAFEHQQLGAFYVVAVPAIPRNAGGKIQRAALREMIAAIAGRSPRG